VSKLRFFVTTPIYYINDVPHIGHAYTTIAADVVARWNRLLGKKVFFLTGLDEHSIKTVKAAHAKGILNIQTYTDEMAQIWINAWTHLNISNDDFIRTTETRHQEMVCTFFKKVFDHGDIYKDRYTGLYCEDCEQFYTSKDLENGLCPFHKKPPKQIMEENYFFRLSNYQKPLLDRLATHPDFIQPEARRNEVLSFIQSGLRDVSISRPNLEWGIDLPLDTNQKFWVWFDALINYLSADPSQWPATVHIIGKDILRFHCVIWPALLMSAGYDLPKTIVVHGFFTIKGQKISKSLGNTINPIKLVNTYGVDAFRYFLLREIPFGSDGDFSEASLIQRINSDLADNLGNLVNRILVLVERNCDNVIPPFQEADELVFYMSALPAKVRDHIEAFQFHNALIDIWNAIATANKYLNKTQPWKLHKKTMLGNIVYNLLETLRYIAILMSPFMPGTSGIIMEQLGLEPRYSFHELHWGLLTEGTRIQRRHILFHKIS
jgi:methionyl-tRNA synthetase